MAHRYYFLVNEFSVRAAQMAGRHIDPFIDAERTPAGIPAYLTDMAAARTAPRQWWPEGHSARRVEYHIYHVDFDVSSDMSSVLVDGSRRYP